MKPILFDVVMGFSLLFAAPNTLHADPMTIKLLPTASTESLGSVVPIDIEIQNLGQASAPSLGVFDLTLTFDPSVLSFESAIFGDSVLGDQLDPTGFGNTVSFATASSGSIELFDLSLDDAKTLNALQTSQFVLASLLFDAVGTGNSTLMLTANALGDADGNSLTAILQNGTVMVTTAPITPEPNSLVLTVWAIVLVALAHGRSGPR